MNSFLLVSQQVAILFALIGLGALCRRCRWLEANAIHGIVNVLVILVTPALVVQAFQRPFDGAMMRDLCISFGVVVLIHVLAIAVPCLLVRDRRQETQGVLQVAAGFGNAGFMGLPLEYALLGDEGVFFGVVYIAIFNVFIWSWGLMRIRGESVLRMSGPEMLKTLANPGFIGLALGLPWFFLSITLPSVIAVPVKMLADLNTPLAMIVIGFYLAGANLKPMFRRFSAYMCLLTRLVVMPLMVLGCLYPFRHVLNPRMMIAFVIATAAPAAALTSMIAAKYNKDVDMAVGMVSGSTLVSILTMPPVIALGMELLSK